MAPQKEQASPSLFRKGEFEAQVPENSPSFFAQILTAIPNRPKPKRAAATRINFKVAIGQRYAAKKVYEESGFALRNDDKIITSAVRILHR